MTHLDINFGTFVLLIWRGHGSEEFAESAGLNVCVRGSNIANNNSEEISGKLINDRGLYMGERYIH